VCRAVGTGVVERDSTKMIISRKSPSFGSSYQRCENANPNYHRKEHGIANIWGKATTVA
jgi:hypothetical protein